MILRLQRQPPEPNGTPGDLFIDGEWFCYTLENPPGKDKGPIPTGTYSVIVNESARFKRLLPLLLDVPNFTGIRMHPGNTDADTEGCILLGMVRLDGPALGRSRDAVDRFLARFTEPATIEIA